MTPENEEAPLLGGARISMLQSATTNREATQPPRERHVNLHNVPTVDRVFLLVATEVLILASELRTNCSGRRR